MAYEVTYSANADCVCARIEGIVDLIVVQQYAQEIIRQLSAHKCLRLLNDMRQTSIRLSTVDLYELPAWIEEAGVDRSCRRALVVARDFSDYRFYETVSRNHGHLLEVFSDSSVSCVFRDKARACEWLALKTNTLAKQDT